MLKSSFIEFCRALHAAGVRYIIVGGYAVIAHGYLRATLDLDIMADLADEQTSRLAGVLESLGYRPRAPVPMRDFADASKRESWVAEKGAQVFTALRHSKSGMDEIDIFLTHPFPFEEAYADVMWREVAGDLRIPFIDINRLREMKRAAGRQKDHADIAGLDRLSRGNDAL